MPIKYLSALTAVQRTARSNRHFGVTLAFVAGALNAGGFLAIGQYTSHMTGFVSLAADYMVLGNLALALAALLSILSFLCGAASTAILVNFARRKGSAAVYTAPLLIEAALLALFGVVGTRLQTHALVNISLLAMLLCYAMGLQNALVTKVSNAEIRTTHVTGLITDFGIELGKLVYWNRGGAMPSAPQVRANRERLGVHGSLIGAFFVGGLSGAAGFNYLGFTSAIPLALVLAVIALAPNLEARRLRD
ncbi:MAG TPA: YoaK family protein [Noviherbaspirillum sp.]